MRPTVLAAVLVVAACAATPAFGSAIVGRNVTRATLSVDRQGHAHVGYSAGGRRTTLAAWGAINARTPNRKVPQVRFQLRYGAGGRGACLPYDGPPLAWLVKACKAPDGSYWALQSWQRLKPNFGGTRGAWELHLSHWRGALAQLVIYQNWAYGARPPYLRPPHLRRRRRLRLHLHRPGEPTRQLRPERLRRHLRLGLRQGLAPREQLPHPSPRPHARRLLLRLLPVRRPSERRRSQVPRDRRRPRRHAGRDVVGRRHRLLRRGRPGSDAGVGAELARPEVPRLELVSE